MTLRCVIMGVAGCGKSSVGDALAAHLGAIYLDGDDLHPPSNIEKMSSGVPLTDIDRAPWLKLVGETFLSTNDDRLVGCSALRKTYRDMIRSASGQELFFLHLSGTKEVITERMGKRTGHFMPTRLIDSQFATLEPLGGDERGAVVDINQSFEAVVSDCIAALEVPQN